MIVKLHKSDGNTIVAVCDKELIDQKFEEGNKQLDLTSSFYKGEEKTPIEIGDLIRNGDIINLVGEKSIKLGLKEEIIDELNIIRIKNIPHAQAINDHV